MDTTAKKKSTNMHPILLPDSAEVTITKHELKNRQAGFYRMHQSHTMSKSMCENT
jgi:hypothetical protein